MIASPMQIYAYANASGSGESITIPALYAGTRGFARCAGAQIGRIIYAFRSIDGHARNWNTARRLAACPVPSIEIKGVSFGNKRGQLRIEIKGVSFGNQGIKAESKGSASGIKGIKGIKGVKESKGSASHYFQSNQTETQTGLDSE